tara:strand:- start:18897 stop:19673 length:777 start_codon:yes stop_codon:yes gene_type:complete
MIAKNHVSYLLTKDLRSDGRKLDEYRKPINVEVGVSSKSAEGSSRVKIGETEVVAGVKLDIGDPYPDTPEQGNLVVNVELAAMSSPEFESGPPNIDAIEMARIVDRGIRESGCIDLKKLCIKKGELIWMVYVDVYTINDAGNLYDACALAAVAALKDAKLPKYSEKEKKVLYDQRTSKELPLKDIPISMTLIKIKDKILVDPTTEEEKSTEARLTVATLEDGTVCALQKGEDSILDIKDVKHMVELAIKKSKDLRKVL